MDVSKKIAILLMEEEDDEDEYMFRTLFTNRDEDLMFQRRREEGAYYNLVRRHLFTNEAKFKEYFRLSTALFREVLSLIEGDVAGKCSNRRGQPISAEEKLCLTLRYLATGESFRSLAFQYRISHSWIGHLISEVLEAIVKNLMEIYLPVPTTIVLEGIEKDFSEMWGFPNCCGAIDGKHIRIVCPKNSGSAFFNYKDYFSTVLMALVDGNYKFIAVDIGSYGREGDSGIFQKSHLGQQLMSGQFNLPPPKNLPGTNSLLPHVLIGDAAFALSENMMKPFPTKQTLRDKAKAIYNYRHCRARRTSENAFGIMCQYFRVFFTPIACNIKTVDKLVLACCILHNMLRQSNIPCPAEGDESSMKMPDENLVTIASSHDRHSSFLAQDVREKFKMYFNSSQGALSWQTKKVNRTK